MSLVGRLLGMHQRKTSAPGNIPKFKNSETPAMIQVYLGNLRIQ